MIYIRSLDRNSKTEIELVAERMKKTLIDVMGEEKGASFYSDEWLLERVQYHIDLKEKSEILLACDSNQKIIGQAIIRIDKDESISPDEFGFFSTIYVSPECRRQGVARRLIEEVHHWCREKKIKLITYSTAKDHLGLQSLLSEFGYKIIIKTDEMVKLTCPL